MYCNNLLVKSQDIIETPAVTPTTIPLDEPIEIFALLLLQVPPEVLQVEGSRKPTHIAEAPETEEGNGLIVIIAVVKHEVL
jgi:hypothetical protein